MKHGIAFIMAALAVMGCHSSHSSEAHHHHHEHEHEAAIEAHEHHDTGEIVFDEHRQELFGIETETVAPAPFNSVIKAGGRFSQSPGDDIIVVAPIAGVVHFSSALVSGTELRAGKSFASISTGELAGADPAVKVKSAYESAKAEYLRDSVMVQESIVSVSHFEQSRANYLQAKSEYDAFYSSEKGNGIAVTPKQGGYLRSLEVSAGQYVEAGATIAVISKGSKLTLTVDVPERYAAALRGVRNANFAVPTGEIYSVKELGGRLLSMSHGAQDGYFTLSFEVPDNGIPVSGAFAEVWLEGNSSKECISVPNGALIEEQGVFSVFVQLDEDCFRKQPVSVGAGNGLRTEIKSGLAAGETVVSKGAMHIKLASAVAVPSGHNHQH